MGQTHENIDFVHTYNLSNLGFSAYGGCALGAEPRYTAPEAVVLPLDDLGMILQMWANNTKQRAERQTPLRKCFGGCSDVNKLFYGFCS